MPPLAPVITEEPVFQRLAEELLAGSPARVLLVADTNTSAACGAQVEEALRSTGLPLSLLLLPGSPTVAADETSIARLLQALDGAEAALVAVGSGSITDVVRFVAYQARLPFYSVPTAASVDAYTSYTAAITIDEIKYSFLTKTPAGVYVHLPTLCSAPRRMTASGFGDMIAKYTGLADWELAHLLVGEEYDEPVALRAGRALSQVAGLASHIRTAKPEGVAALVDSLMVSGDCMVTAQSSRPAAGAEHSLAHFWEIKHHLDGIPPSLHGEKTGVGAVIIAQLYADLRALSFNEAAERIENFSPPDLEQETERVRIAYGRAAEQIIASRPSYLGTFREKAPQVAARLLADWDKVQAIAAKVPPPEALAALLEKAGSLNHPAQIHVTSEEADLALHHAMYVRDRFTILEIDRMLGLSYV